jgi:lipid-A-disaccharide synthase-like uncharacterized protein
MSLDAVPAGWLALGFLGQAFFSCRFVVQWAVSERKKTSVVPTLFWWLSLGGGLCLLGYAMLRRDIVFIAGQSAGLLVYTRNLMLLRRAAACAPSTE